MQLDANSKGVGRENHASQIDSLQNKNPAYLAYLKTPLLLTIRTIFPHSHARHMYNALSQRPCIEISSIEILLPFFTLGLIWAFLSETKTLDFDRLSAHARFFL